MGDITGIQWTATPMPSGEMYPGGTFNPWIGCTEVSEECDNCYARTGSARLGAQHGLKLWDGDRFFTSESYWKKPLTWNRAAAKAGVRKKVFCASYADVFEDRPDLVEKRLRLWRLIWDTQHLDWLLLTKRPENIARMLPWGAERVEAVGYRGDEPWQNVWLGTTCGLGKSLPRVVDLVKAPPAPVKFVSIEPMIEDFDIPDELLGPGAITWEIVGGESGPRSRPFNVAAANVLREQCARRGVAFFMKQLGAKPHVGGARIELADGHGGDMAEWPEVAPRVREFPTRAPSSVWIPSEHAVKRLAEEPDEEPYGLKDNRLLQEQGSLTRRRAHP